MARAPCKARTLCGKRSLSGVFAVCCEVLNLFYTSSTFRPGDEVCTSARLLPSLGFSLGGSSRSLQRCPNAAVSKRRAARFLVHNTPCFTPLLGGPRLEAFTAGLKMSTSQIGLPLRAGVHTCSEHASNTWEESIEAFAQQMPGTTS